MRKSKQLSTISYNDLNFPIYMLNRLSKLFSLCLQHTLQTWCGSSPSLQCQAVPSAASFNSLTMLSPFLLLVSVQIFPQRDAISNSLKWSVLFTLTYVTLSLLFQISILLISLLSIFNIKSVCERLLLTYLLLHFQGLVPDTHLLCE